mmetsp:Transcript_122434/g.346139  ORF Transcript_122434/g.346139 Transcript_122434/m.346139 type:complete len:844 (+) Transcript_122434:118-2649(+)|eukprot:CAMPEP_0117528736 /NCGR_PEP_ID=MMETSP0784-20121206/37467_1 /TAXON_ID=39447 /ORGANISM="" /LENGTH=843 /DNA_ID=CAMNT_0005325029 /DNA_START=20 /DNA_END=2551 /DNA_ORIENTATION=-
MGLPRCSSEYLRRFEKVPLAWLLESKNNFYVGLSTLNVLIAIGHSRCLCIRSEVYGHELPYSAWAFLSALAIRFYDLSPETQLTLHNVRIVVSAILGCAYLARVDDHVYRHRSLGMVAVAWRGLLPYFGLRMPRCAWIAACITIAECVAASHTLSRYGEPGFERIAVSAICFSCLSLAWCHSNLSSWTQCYELQQSVTTEKKAVEGLLGMFCDATLWLAEDGCTVLKGSCRGDDLMGFGLEGTTLSACFPESEYARVRRAVDTEVMAGAPVRLLHSALQLKSSTMAIPADIYILDIRNASSGQLSASSSTLGYLLGFRVNRSSEPHCETSQCVTGSTAEAEAAEDRILAMIREAQARAGFSGKPPRSDCGDGFKERDTCIDDDTLSCSLTHAEVTTIAATTCNEKAQVEVLKDAASTESEEPPASDHAEATTIAATTQKQGETQIEVLKCVASTQTEEIPVHDRAGDTATAAATQKRETRVEVLKCMASTQTEEMLAHDRAGVTATAATTQNGETQINVCECGVSAKIEKLPAHDRAGAAAPAAATQDGETQINVCEGGVSTQTEEPPAHDRAGATATAATAQNDDIMAAVELPKGAISTKFGEPPTHDGARATTMAAMTQNGETWAEVSKDAASMQTGGPPASDPAEAAGIVSTTQEDEVQSEVSKAAAATQTEDRPAHDKTTQVEAGNSLLKGTCRRRRTIGLLHKARRCVVNFHSGNVWNPKFKTTPEDSVSALLMDAFAKLNPPGRGCCHLHMALATCVYTCHNLLAHPCTNINAVKAPWQCTVCFVLNEDDNGGEEGEPECVVCWTARTRVVKAPSPDGRSVGSDSGYSGAAEDARSS